MYHIHQLKPSESKRTLYNPYVPCYDCLNIKTETNGVITTMKDEKKDETLPKHHRIHQIEHLNIPSYRCS